MRNAGLIARAKAMRTAPSQPEQRMWLALRAARFAGVKFRRQKVIGPFIVDFASRVPMLVVEIDGDTHAERTIEDDDRSRFLEQQGYRVIRYTNYEVMTNLEGVLTHLAGVVATAPLPTQHRVNSAPRCPGHAGGMTDPMLPEGERAL